MKVTHKNAILCSQVEIQEQTFQHMSREIHDNIGQKLIVAKLHLNTYSSNAASIDPRIHDSIKILTETISDLSDLSRSMSSEQILNNGLIAALEEEVAYLRQTGKYVIELNVSGNFFGTDKSAELVLLRIVQEALNNVIKHSNASRITIEFAYDNAGAELTITDNGCGFLITKKNESGIGLANMKKRAMIIGGNCTITSKPGEGTSLMIKIPAND